MPFTVSATFDTAREAASFLASIGAPTAATPDAPAVAERAIKKAKDTPTPKPSPAPSPEPVAASSEATAPTPAPTPAAAAQPPAAEVKVEYAELAKAVGALASAKGNDAARAAVASLNVKHCKELPESRWAEALDVFMKAAA